jgi:hypothetical protein
VVCGLYLNEQPVDLNVLNFERLRAHRDLIGSGSAREALSAHAVQQCDANRRVI